MVRARAWRAFFNFPELIMPSNAQVKTAIVALAAYALVAIIQRNVTPIPVIGQYLPGSNV